MLSHQPHGIGHPYRHEPDQRIPVHPVAGEKWRVRARSDEATEAIILHLNRGTRTELHPLSLLGVARSQDHGPFGKTAKYTGGNTHLADAAARSGEYPGELGWEVNLPPLENFENASYWLQNDRGERTETFEVSALVWGPDQQGFLVQNSNGVAPVQISNSKTLRNAHGEIFKARTSLPLGPEDHVVGFGERFHSVDQRGQYVDAIVYEEYKGQGHRTYLPAPFGIIIGSGYGFYINSSTPSRFDIAVTQPDAIIIEVDIAPEQTTCEINLYFGNPAEILHQYISEFELPKTPPEWIYSLWGSSNEWNTQERVESEITLSKLHGIDLGVVVLEAWSDESTFAVFRDAQYTPTDGSVGLAGNEIAYPSDGAWPNPQQMIDGLHEQNIKLILWQIPVVKEEGEPGTQINAIWKYAIENNLVVKDSTGSPYKIRGFWFRDGLLPDLTDSNVRDWWGRLHKYLVVEMGVDGFKTDGGEHAWGTDLQYLDGQRGIAKNNLFPVSYARTFHELFASSEREGITFSRAGFAGSSTYPTFWAGDEDSTWDAYRASIRAGITASASGIFFWGWDIGGFSGELPTTELYLRGAAMATFCPIMQFHSEFNHHREPSNDRSPWNIAQQNRSPEVIGIFREFGDVRARLKKYLASEGEIAIATGRPLMAGLFFDYSTDEKIWAAPYQYMLGRYLLVAPVVETHEEEIRVYLPEGRWLDFWDRNILHAGNNWIVAKTPLNRIPVYIDASAPQDVITL